MKQTSPYKPCTNRKEILPSMPGMRMQYKNAAFIEVEFHSKTEFGKEEIFTLMMTIANNKACLRTHGE